MTGSSDESGKKMSGQKDLGKDNLKEQGLRCGFIFFAHTFFCPIQCR